MKFGQFMSCSKGNTFILFIEDSLNLKKDSVEFFVKNFSFALLFKNKKSFLSEIKNIFLSSKSASF